MDHQKMSNFVTNAAGDAAPRRTQPLGFQSRRQEALFATVTEADLQQVNAQRDQGQFHGHIASVDPLKLDSSVIESPAPSVQATSRRSRPGRDFQKDWERHVGGRNNGSISPPEIESDYEAEEDDDSDDSWGRTPSRRGGNRSEENPTVVLAPLSGTAVQPNGVISIRGRRKHQVRTRSKDQLQPDRSPHTGATGKRNRDSIHSAHNESKAATPRATSPVINEIDFNAATLKTMEYAELKAQPFDDDPSPRKPGPKQFSENATLEAKLLTVKNLGADKQADFLKSLSMEEWDEAGDWFLEQFTKMMGEMREARKEKRNVSKQYEEEVSKRWEAIEKGKEDVRKNLDGLRQLGATALGSASR